MTQFQQIVDALKALNGSGTADEILSKIDTSKWTAKVPRDTVTSYLYTKDCFQKDGKVWTYTPNEKAASIKTGSTEEDDTVKSTKVTQLEQVIAAIKELGGKATAREIYSHVDVSSWKAKDPMNSILGMLSACDVFQKGDDHYWIYSPTADSTSQAQAQETADEAKVNANNGLYLITLSHELESAFSGIVFKVGSTSRGNDRLLEYSRCLPVNPIRFLKFYPISTIYKLSQIEDSVRMELLTRELPIKISKVFTSSQQEWLQSDRLQYIPKDLSKLVGIVSDVVDSVIEEM